MTSPPSARFEKASVTMDDGRSMSLVYGVPENSPEPSSCMVIAHGAGGPMYSPFITHFHSELARNGILTVKFNFPYMEAKKKIPDRMDILKKSYARILENIRARAHSPGKIFIGGKSMGGRVASMLAADGIDVDGLFFLGYPLHSPGNFGTLRDEHLYRIGKPMLFVSGTRDTFARKDLLEMVLAKIGNNAQVQWVEGGDHSFKGRGGKDELAETYKTVLARLLDWANEVSFAS
jgi:uncharacterized protein